MKTFNLCAHKFRGDSYFWRGTRGRRGILELLIKDMHMMKDRGSYHKNDVLVCLYKKLKLICILN